MIELVGVRRPRQRVGRRVVVASRSAFGEVGLNGGVKPPGAVTGGVS